MINKIKKLLKNPLIVLVPLYLWLLVDTLNGLLMRFVDMPVTISNVFKAIVLFLALTTIRNRKHLYIAFAAIGIIAVATVAHLFNPLSAGISRFTLIFEDLLAGVKLVSPIVFTLSLLTIIPALKDRHGKHLRLILLANLGVIALNLGLSLIGVGYSQYKAGLGARGFFLSGNELALVFLTISSAILYFRRNLKSVVYILFVAVIMTFAFLLGTKVAVLGTAFMIGFISLLLRYDSLSHLFTKKRLTKKNLIWIVGFFALLVIGAVIAWKVPYTQDVYWRTRAMIDMSGNTISGLLSQRDVLAGAALTYIKNHFTGLDYIFGIGYDNISRAMAVYPPFRTGITELDMVDLFFYLGGLSLFYYGLWVYMLVKMVVSRPATSAIIFAVVFNLLLLVISTFSGYTLFSAINAPFWATVNVIGLTGVSMKLGLGKMIKKLYQNKLLFVAPALLFIGIDAISTLLRVSSTPTITLSLVYKALAVLFLIPLLKRKQLIFLIFASIVVILLAGIHLLNPLSSLSGLKAVAFGDLQLMFKLLLPVVYALAFYNISKTLKRGVFGVTILVIFAANFLLIIGNELIGLLQLLQTEGLTSITSILGQKGLLFSWNEFSVGYVTIGGYLLYRLRNKNPIVLSAFAVLLLFGTLMVSKKVAIFGTLLFTALTFFIFRYDLLYKALNRNWKGIKRYLIWAIGIIVIGAGLVFAVYKSNLSSFAPTYKFQLDRVTFAYEKISEGDLSPAMEALFSGRNRFAISAAESMKNDFRPSDYIFGIGYRNINTAVGKYQPDHPGITEIDPIDLYMSAGIFAGIYYIAWFVWIVWLGTKLKRSPYFIYIFCLNIFLAAASATSGHVIYSGLNGPFFGIINGVALAINYHKNIKDKHNLVLLSGTGKGGVRAWLDTVSKYLKPIYKTRFKVIRTHAEVEQNLLNIIVFAFALVKLKWYVFIHAGETTIYHINVEQGGSFVRAAIAARLISWIPKSKLVLHIHGARFFEYADKLRSSVKGKRRLTSLFRNSALEVVISLTPSRKTELDALLSELGIKPEFEHLVVPNPIEFDALKSIKKKEYNGILELIYVGRLVEQKNLLTLLKAVSLLVRQGIENVHLSLVGEGDQRPIFEDFISKNSLHKYVTLTGWIEHSKVAEYYDKAHLFVLPSIFESFGIVVLEAYANRLPIVASNTGGLKDLVDEGVNGFKINPTDISGIASSIKKFIDNPALINKMGAQNYEKAKTFDLPIVGKQLINAYEVALRPMMPKLMLIASSGGHLNQLMMLKPWWGKYRRMFVAYDKIDGRTLLKDEPHVLSKHTSIRNPFHVFATAWLAYKTIHAYRPDLIFSTGEGLCVPFFYVGKYLFGAKTVLLDSLSKTHPSLSAYLSYFTVDELLTQWPDVTRKWKRFKYAGRVI